MPYLPDSLKITFFEALSGEKSTGDFEQWVYTQTDLEAYLNSSDYLDLISTDFSSSASQQELFELLHRQIDAGEYETWRLNRLLRRFVNREGNLPLMLCEFYDLYCRGFCFLKTLGLEYGLSIKVPPSEYSADYWQDLSEAEKTKLLDSLLPGALEEAQKVLAWLEEGKIAIASTKNERGYPRYTDNRTDKS